MTRLWFWLGLLSALLFGYSASGEATPPQHSEDKNQKIDACSLATGEEVGAIQGAKMLDPKSSEGPEMDFVLSQCYYGSVEPDKSVSLGVMQRNPTDPGTRTIAQFWHETFDHLASAENGEGAEKKRQEDKGEDNKEHEGVRPQKIEGIGEESYWLGNPMGGILYVLKNDRMLRISFGGPGNADEKLGKSKAFAQKAIGRLPK
jgi:hypothetical protein